jgi:hypothetical protein
MFHAKKVAWSTYGVYDRFGPSIAGENFTAVDRPLLGESGCCQTGKPCSRIPDRFAAFGASRLIAIQCTVGRSRAGILRELIDDRLAGAVPVCEPLYLLSVHT